MGLDSFDLNLDERFRPWRDAGLRFILGRSGTDRLSKTVKKPGESVISPYRSSILDRKDGPNKRKATTVAAPRRETGKSTSDKASQPISREEEWPNPWDVYKTTLKAPCATVWTYWDLGLDLGGQPSTERRELMRGFIGYAYNACNWTKGSVTFWPMSAIGSRGLTADADMFWKGVDLAMASVVVVFGARAFEVLFPERAFELGRFEYAGHTILVMPGPANLLDDPDEFESLVQKELSAFPNPDLI